MSKLVLVLYLLGTFAVVCSWGHALEALRIRDCTVLPRNRETTEYLIDVDEETAERHIYQCYSDTLEKLKFEIDEKSRKLNLAYEDIVFSAWCLGLAAVVFIFMEMTK